MLSAIGRIIMPIVSVIMPVYNEKEYMIQEAIDSVIRQTFTNWELIIVCDNIYDDGFKHFLLRIKDQRIKVLFNKQNLGSALSRNEGIKIASGKYIAFLDADDICMPDRIEAELKYLEEKRCDMICGGRHLIDEQGNIIKSFEAEMTEQRLLAYLPYINYVYNSTVLIEKRVLDNLGGYRDYPGGHDYELWMRVREAGYKIGYLDKDVLGYRIRSNSITGNNAYLQTIDCAYIRRLYRKNKLCDSYNEQTYKNYVKRFLKRKDQAVHNFNRSIQKRKNFAERIEKGKYISALCEYIGAILGSRIYRLNIYNSIRFKLFLLRNRGL